MTSARYFASIFGLFVLASMARGQAEMWRVVVDSQLRPGANFATIHEGVAAVAPGGTVFVRTPGLGGQGYWERVPVVIDKPVTIAGVPNARLPRPPVLDRFIVRDIVGQEQVVLRDLLLSDGLFSTHDCGLVVERCAGSVWVDRCYAGGVAYPVFDIRIQNSARVHIRECVFYSGAQPILVEDSGVVIERSTLFPGFGLIGFPQFPSARAAITVGAGADVTLIGSEVFGAGTYPGGEQFPVEMGGGTIRVDSQSKLISGQWSGLAIDRPTGPIGGEFWLDPAAIVIAVFPYVSLATNLVQAPVRIVDAGTPYRGLRYTAELRGAHGPDLFGAIVLTHGVPSPFPNLHPTIGQGTEPDYTTAWMDPASAQIVYLGPPNGQVTLSAEFLPLQATMVLQGVMFGADNVIRLTPPLTQVVVSADIAR